MKCKRCDDKVGTPVELNGKIYCSNLCCGYDNGGRTPAAKTIDGTFTLYKLPGNP